MLGGVQHFATHDYIVWCVCLGYGVGAFRVFLATMYGGCALGNLPNIENTISVQDGRSHIVFNLRHRRRHHVPGAWQRIRDRDEALQSVVGAMTATWGRRAVPNRFKGLARSMREHWRGHVFSSTTECICCTACCTSGASPDRQVESLSMWGAAKQENVTSIWQYVKAYANTTMKLNNI